MSRSPLPRRLAALALAGSGVAFPVAVGAADDPAETAGFVATASASDARVTYSVLNFAAVTDVVDGGGATAQSQLDGAGNGRAYAALPHPGEVVVAGPGLFAFATGQQLPGGYPFYVTAENPVKPEGRLDGPGGNYSLLAQAAPQRSSGTGRLVLGDGSNGGRSESRALTEAAGDGTVRSVAETVTQGLSLGDGVLQIASVHSRSVTSLPPGAAKPVSESAFSVQGMTVAGTAVTVGPDGLVVAGTELAPGDSAAEVEQRLADAGIQVRVVEAEAVPGGQRARSFEISTLQTPPIPGFPAQSGVIAFGGATTAIEVGEASGGLPVGVPAEPDAAAPEGGTPERPAPPAIPNAPAGAADPAATPTAAPATSSGMLPAGRRSAAPAAPRATHLPATTNIPADLANPADLPAGNPATDATGPAAGAEETAAAPVAEPAMRRVTLARDLKHPITGLFLPLAVGAALLGGGGFLWCSRGGRPA